VIRLITIDCWDTVLRINSAWDGLLVDIAFSAFRVRYPNIDRQTVTAAFSAENADFSRILRDKMVTPRLMTRLTTLAAYAQVQLSEHALLQLQTNFEKAILSPLPELIPGARQFLLRVKKEQLKICLMSNTGWFSSGAIDTALERCDVAHLFDFFAYSDRVGSAKPSAKIFEFALSAARCRPSEAIHIGDKLRTDIAGALNAGLCAIHFHTGEPCTDRKVPCASNYDEIWTILSSRLALPRDRFDTKC
jgi:HAD superfamily hydrolase (TIGR01549 family)